MYHLAACNRRRRPSLLSPPAPPTAIFDAFATRTKSENKLYLIAWQRRWRQWEGSTETRMCGPTRMSILWCIVNYKDEIFTLARIYIAVEMPECINAIYGCLAIITTRQLWVDWTHTHTQKIITVIKISLKFPHDSWMANGIKLHSFYSHNFFRFVFFFFIIFYWVFSMFGRADSRLMPALWVCVLKRTPLCASHALAVKRAAVGCVFKCARWKIKKQKSGCNVVHLAE